MTASSTDRRLLYLISVSFVDPNRKWQESSGMHKKMQTSTEQGGLAVKLRVGLIGCGGIVHGHVRRFKETGEVTIAALQDPSPKAIETLVSKYELPLATPRFADHREMLKAVKLDAVLIASPHTLHLPQTVDALDAGLHVLLEKPMVCSTAEAEQLIDRVSRTDRVLMLSYQRHWEPIFLYARQLVESGALGRLTYIQALLSQSWMQGTTGTWRQVPELGGGGMLLDSGSHICDMLLWIPQQRVETVSGRVDFRGRPVDINTGAVLRYEDGLMGTLTIIGDAASWWEDWTVSGEEGTLYIRNGRLFLQKPKGSLEQIAPEQLPKGSDPNWAFVELVRGRRRNETPVEVGLGVIRLTEAIWKSGEAGGVPVRV
jgi:predicted dehydrogenase